MTHVTQEALRGAKNLVLSLGDLQAGEAVVVVSDTDTKDLGALLARIAEEGGGKVSHFTVAPYPIHGTEPPDEVARAMAESRLIFGITGKSMAHTKARLRACDGGARYLSLPEYTWDMLENPAMGIDFKVCAARAKVVADVLTRAKDIHITTDAGTDIRLSAEGRAANFCPGYVDRDHRLGSPPDIESNVSPVEDASEGVVVVDGSIAAPGFGRLPEPVILTVKGGLIREMRGHRETVAKLDALFAKYPENAKVLAEFGIGFNPEAKLCGNMLMDEGCFGTFHFGFGSNATVGGKNSVPFHLDFIFYAGGFFADGERVRVSS